MKMKRESGIRIWQLSKKILLILDFKHSAHQVKTPKSRNIYISCNSSFVKQEQPTSHPPPCLPLFL
ncbi:unnamed protein product [Linum tenue]|uniref:Uncharacterized protein n=1 Tax=Linum tenue TaxID=586396 RepID=A0AAV0H3C9_9ROSI|nr:unnamed protein product [Linum tenue]